MNEADAKAAFRRMGIVSPSRGLIENWLKVARRDEALAQETAAERSQMTPSPPATQDLGSEKTQVPAAPFKPAQPGKSLLEPILRAQEALEKPSAKRKPGRPRIIASWFPAVAETMADGTTMRMAVAINRLTLGPGEMRALYRNRTFKALYQEARRRYLLENWGRKGPSLRSVIGRIL